MVYSENNANNDNSDENERTYFDPAGPEKDAWWEQGCDLERKSEPSSQTEPERSNKLISHINQH